MPVSWLVAGNLKLLKLDVFFYLVVADPFWEEAPAPVADGPGIEALNSGWSSMSGKDVGVDGEEPKIVSSSVGAAPNGGGDSESGSFASNRNIRWRDFRDASANFCCVSERSSDAADASASALRTLEGGWSCVGFKHWIGFRVFEYLSRLLPDDRPIPWTSLGIVVAIELSSLVFDVRGPNGGREGIHVPFSPSSVDPAPDPLPGLRPTPCIRLPQRNPVCTVSPSAPYPAVPYAPRLTKLSLAVPAIFASLANLCIGDFLTCAIMSIVISFGGRVKDDFLQGWPGKNKSNIISIF